jgi:hypothetical protein
MSSIPFWVRPWGLWPLAAQTRSSSMRSSGEIQQESSTFPSRLEVQRLVAKGRSLMSQAMYTSVRSALMVSLALGIATPGWTADCEQLEVQRDQLARRALAAEVVLLHAQRQELCPQLEAPATATGEANKEVAGLPAQLDYGAYIRCREQAEMQLRASRPVLYTNHSGFPFLTPDGARLARQADALLKARQAGCSTPPPAPTQSPQPSRSER